MKFLFPVIVAAAAVVSTPAFANLELAQKKNCLACHAVNKKLVGPAYQEVAGKYAGDKDAAYKLAKKIKEGGAGVWGPVPMRANPQVNDAEARQLATWVLSLSPPALIDQVLAVVGESIYEGLGLTELASGVVNEGDFPAWRGRFGFQQGSLALSYGEESGANLAPLQLGKIFSNLKCRGYCYLDYPLVSLDPVKIKMALVLGQ